MPINRSSRIGKKQIEKQVSRSETWLKRVVFHPFRKAWTPKKESIFKETCKQNAVPLSIQKHAKNIHIKVQKTFRKCCLIFPNAFWTFGRKRWIKKRFNWEFFNFCRGFKMKMDKQNLKVRRFLLWNEKAIFWVNFTFDTP